jgi:hypothetical protein
MAVTIGVNQLNSGARHIDGTDGRVFVQPVRVDGITVATTGAVVVGTWDELPDIGDDMDTPYIFADETAPNGWVLERIESAEDANSRASGVAQLHWRRLDYYEQNGYHGTACRVRFNGSVMREQTRFDDEGNPFVVWYVKDAAAGSSQAAVSAMSGADQQPAQATILLPQSVLEFERYEKFTEGDETSDQAYWPHQFRRMANLGDWQGKHDGCWCCMNIDQERWDQCGRGDLWLRRYRFELLEHPAGPDRSPWDPVLWYQRPNSPRPPADVNPAADGFPDSVNDGNGWVQWDTIRRIAFETLGLPSVF